MLENSCATSNIAVNNRSLSSVGKKTVRLSPCSLWAPDIQSATVTHSQWRCGVMSLGTWLHQSEVEPTRILCYSHCRTSYKTSATYGKKRAPPMIHQFPLVWWEGDLLTGRVNSRLTHCQHNPRGSLLENLVLWCQVAPHNSPVGLLSVMSHAQCGCVAAERPVITAAPCGKAAWSNTNKILSEN